jgi:hypothetical protein
MALTDPVAAYNAANNMEAHLVKNALVDAGIEAYVSEDFSVVGMWLGGLIPEIHKPQVWIERADSERAAPILADFEARAAELRDDSDDDDSDTVEVLCEACGKHSVFPQSQRGSVQQCAHCRAYVDVGGDAFTEGPPPGTDNPDAENDEAIEE